jgi:hypothetical protein
VALLGDGMVGVRDAKLPVDSPYLVFDRYAWRGFISGIKTGEFGNA